MATDLPAEHRALVLEAVGAGFKVQTRKTPAPGPGSVVVRVLAAGIVSYAREIYDGTRHYAFPTPIVGGTSCIARVAAPGPDATALAAGQLVFVDCVVRARDDPTGSLYLSAIHEGTTEGTRKLIRDVWREAGPFAEYAKVPLENCIPLDEQRLCKELGYSPQDLMHLHYLLVPYGGLRDIGLEPGETVVVCPATGGFGGAGVQVAAAMGARVIAMGRNKAELARLKKFVAENAPLGAACRVETVPITGDAEADTAALRAFGTIDAVLDFSPPQAAQSTHLRSAIMALRAGGRVSLMGVAEYPLPAWQVVSQNIVLRGKLMYERADMLQFVKMLESGLFPPGKGLVETKTFPLEGWQAALDTAAAFTVGGRAVVLTP